jgi:signal transduction histidine kinase
MNAQVASRCPSTGTLSQNVLEDRAMARSRKDSPAPGRRRHRRRPHHDDGVEDSGVRDTSLLEDLDESLLEPEERAYLEARRAAEEKVRLWGKAWKLAIVVVPLMIFIPPVGFIVLFFGGIDVAKRAYKLLYEPKLRQKFVDDEVSKRISRKVHRERRSLEDEHSRSLEKLSASIAHEIRNPITAAKSLVQQMGEDPAGMDNVEYAKVALEELERVERSISHLLRFAREEDMRRVEVRMSEVLDSALETFRERAQREGILIERQFDCDGTLLGDAEQLRRVVINLVGNAVDSLLDAGIESPRIRISMGENLAGNEVWVRIVDNGMGIDEELYEKIFNPFYTSKDHGTGLGLPITKKLVEAHGGEIEVDAASEGGAEFLLTFPKAGAQGGRS